MRMEAAKESRSGVQCVLDAVFGCHQVWIKKIRNYTMRRYVKKQLIELQKSLLDTQEAMCSLIQLKKYEQAYEVIVDLQEALIEVGGIIDQEEREGTQAVSCLEKICEILYNITLEMEQDSVKKHLKRVKKLLNEYIFHVRYDLTNDKLKVVFFPYKASMWTAFESIWKAAMQDETCDVKVVPIPYCDLGNESCDIKWHYEIDEYPGEVPVIPYNQYNLAGERPDIAFIHNPYDDTNTLTSVHPDYYSNNIKNYADCLVYSPYHTFGNYTRGKTDGLILTQGAVNADKIILQSEFTKKIFESYGYASEKLMAYGSPKADAIVRIGNERVIPDEWKDKLEGKKKIFLLNAHWSYFIRGKNYEQEGKFDFAIKYHKEIMEAIQDRKEECGLIWRPHPLLFSSVEKRAPESMKFLREMEQTILKSDYGVIDNSGDYTNAFACSDALISTYSSLINEYMITGKPVLIFQKKPDEDVGKRAPVDYRTCYFKFVSDNGMPFAEFMDMILAEEDPMYEERMNMLKRKSFANLDGSAGEKIYNELKKNYS